MLTFSSWKIVTLISEYLCLMKPRIKHCSSHFHCEHRHFITSYFYVLVVSTYLCSTYLHSRNRNLHVHCHLDIINAYLCIIYNLYLSFRYVLIWTKLFINQTIGNWMTYMSRLHLPARYALHTYMYWQGKILKLESCSITVNTIPITLIFNV